ncbi:MAG TPA: indole-3-glycerol phosphate synthase TrpC [Solirubrobacterales bacterium]|nr:indole-3-glycerol phosphate synthase TrpC [Solirubrobacterales bacterium]
MGMIEELVAAARTGAERRQRQTPLEELEARLADRPEQRPFREALTRPGLSLIAEFKRRSPSAGEIRAAVTPTEIAQAYEQGGAAAVSVLTDESHFGGSLDDLLEARDACVLPVLQKDFIVGRYQLYEAAVAGADAVLLIVAALRRDDLLRLHEEARRLDLDVLVEVHTEEELDTALGVDAEVIGINNRNLEDFTVHLATTFELITDVPAGKTVVSESGIADRGTLEELERVGVDAVLIGEALMRADDPAAKVRELTADEESTREHLLP